MKVIIKEFNGLFYIFNPENLCIEWGCETYMDAMEYVLLHEYLVIEPQTN